MRFTSFKAPWMSTPPRSPCLLRRGRLMGHLYGAARALTRTSPRVFETLTLPEALEDADIVANVICGDGAASRF